MSLQRRRTGASALLAGALSVFVYIAAPPAANAATATPDASLTGPKPLDGSPVEAVETYLNPKTQQLDFGASVFPLDPYYNGFGLSFAYNYFFSKNSAWQAVALDYIFGVDKGLRSKLASQYGVQPDRIEQLNMIIASNYEYIPAYGKFVFLKDYIRYFRSAILVGPAFAVSNQESSIGANVGWRFEAFVNSTFSAHFLIRDIYLPSNIGNNLALVLGTSYAY